MREREREREREMAYKILRYKLIIEFKRKGHCKVTIPLNCKTETPDTLRLNAITLIWIHNTVKCVNQLKKPHVIYTAILYTCISNI